MVYLKPRLLPKKVDARILAPVAAFALRAAKVYIQQFFKPNPATMLLLDRIEKQTARFIEIDNIHEKLYSARHTNS